VKDYKNRPAAGVNLAAVAYNSQFKKDIKVNDPPYLASYRSRRQITRNAYEADDPFTVKKYHVGEHKAWIKKMGVDSLPFFKMIFPATAPYDVATAISDFPPQLSVHIVKKGAPQEIYLLYINRKLVYYNGVTDKVNDAYPAYGYTQIAIRFRDKYLEIDSLYMQPFYKHDLFIDLDHLPLHATVSDVADYWSMAEKNLIELNTWQLKSNVSEAYVWQYDHVVKLSDKTYHLTGPFVKPDTMHYFSPDRFDIHFPFEPGYEYSLSPNILRLEKKALFPNDTAKYYLPKVESPVLIIGDTIQEPPVISYVKGKQATGSPIAEHPFKLSSSWEYSMYKKENNSGRLKLSFLKIDKLKYIAFIKNDSSDTRLIFDANNNNINNIIPGRYHLILVNANWNVAVFDINIFPDQTLCLNTSSAVYSPNDSIIHLLEKKEIPKVIPPTETKTFEIQINNAKNLPNYLAGNALIVGKVTDSKGMLPVMGASVRLKGINFGTSTDNNGIFSINKIQEGRYTIIVSSVGYNSREVNISTSTDTILIQLKPSENHLDEVVVIGYGTVSKRALTGSVISVKAVDITSTINGRAAGVSVTTEGQPGGAPLFFIRGISSIQANHPLYVIDGLLYDELPSNVKTEMVLSTEILTDASATAIYGARAANGVVVITTGSKTSRKNFKDNAIWQPELFTDKNGKASFETTYPDNITGWHLYVMAMDKKKRMGKGQSFVKSFKPLLAQLSSPLFFVENDTSELIGKASNYTNDTYNITTTLKIEKQTIFTASDTIAGSKSLPSSIKMAALQKDTLHVSYQLQTSTGFMDGEERNIPVFAAGMQETKGAFYILPNDTTLHYTSESTGGPVEIYVQNNTLDLLLQELKWLKAYPYYCMEQTASKIKGLYAEKQVLEKMQKPFTEEKQLAYLQKKLAENQLYEGGWSWWQKGKANFQITCYILNTLSEMKRDAVMQSAFRNGLLYLQNKLPGLLKEDQIEALFVMAKAHHAIDFTPYINKIPFDSLSIYQQWQWISVCKEQKLDYSNQLEQVINKRTTILPSGCYWGGENYSWHSNAAATTLLAFNLLRSETKYEYLLPSIVQYFLQLRKNGHWQNTVESASITAALMPYLLEQNKNFNNKATITISGDTSCTISQFPQKIMIGGGKSGHITISKQGGGITFLTLYQQHFDKHPQELSTHFIMQSWFESKGKKLTVIPAGEKIKMVVELNALADADYVMVQIPIPAGCNYASKPQDYQMHYEYFKNKTEIFAEHITKGKHRFEIELESRYKGSYTLNPAQALLMYFPTFSGNNALTKVAIK
jgi:TonB-dependent SusC/RagA subfamily outer membrane receptor